MIYLLPSRATVSVGALVGGRGAGDVVVTEVDSTSSTPKTMSACGVVLWHTAAASQLVPGRRVLTATLVTRHTASFTFAVARVASFTVTLADAMLVYMMTCPFR